jgi:hypothetical protein
LLKIDLFLVRPLSTRELRKWIMRFLAAPIDFIDRLPRQIAETCSGVGASPRGLEFKF